MLSNRFVTIFSLTFLVVITFIAIQTYNKEQKEILKGIKQELTAGATTLPLLLKTDTHIQDPLSLTQEKLLQYTNDLQKYLKHTNLSYLYSYIKDQKGNIRYSISSDIIKNKPFDLYNDKNLAYVFDTNKTLFVESNDNLGHFQSVYIPMQLSDGTYFVVRADYELKKIRILLEEHKQQILLRYIPLVVLTLIYLFITVKNTTRAQQIINEKTKRIRKIYETDKLTHLPNRNKLLKIIKKFPKLTLAIIDINNFKAVNEIYGAEIADQFLKHTAYEINAIIKYDMDLYKLNSDLFCITSTNMDSSYFEQYLYSLLEQLEKIEFQSGEYRVRATYTAGIAHAENFNNPILAAEYALENAKKSGKKVLNYNGSFETVSETSGKREVLDHINYAIKNGKFFPYFQPIYNLQTQSITKYEALIRMQKPDGEIVAPWYFLQTAIDTGLYKHLSEFMLKSVVQFAKENPQIQFSLNISAVDIENEEIRNKLFGTIITNKVEDQIVLEILESEDFKEYESLINFANEAKQNNIKVSIDDFGSGYSNFANLIEIDFDYLKIDGSLIKNILLDKRYEVVVREILSFAKQLKSQVIAEFVENEAIANKLKELGVDLLQGYYIGKPSAYLRDGLSM